MKEFKGRVIAGGNWTGEAAVSHQGFNTLASFQKNKDLFGVNITGKALC